MVTSSNTLAQALAQHTSHFHSVVPFDPAQHRLLRMDFTDANTALTQDMLLNTELFSNYINELLLQQNCTYGIGGYNEHRTIYSRSEVFDTAGSEEPRRLHLGIDIWGAKGTPVFAPMEGIVHSFANNHRFGDYGATIILQHRIADITFHILFGHLGHADLLHLYAGKKIAAGEVVGHFGPPAENGGWPPHLHIQVIEHLQDFVGDYPGVCRYSERDRFLQNCPNPDLVLAMMQYAKLPA